MTEPKNFILCQELIWLPDTGNKANTYCMREKGHPNDGPNNGHNIVNETPKEPCKDAMCGFANAGIEHEHPDPKDLTRARVKAELSKWHGVYGTNG